MNQFYFFKERKTSHFSLKKTLIHSVSQKLLLISFLTLSIFSMKSQTAPNISYATPQNYLLNAAITSLAPVNSGGSVPALTYKQVSTFAGTTTGFLDGTGTAAKMNGPLGMTMDTSGNVYFVDAANHRIRKITTTGVVTTIAGNGATTWLGAFGDFGDNITGTSAKFNWPAGLVFDAANNCLYVADKENDRIRKISLTGTYAVTTLAGSGTSSSVDGMGTAATFKKPTGITIDPTGTYLYVTDRTGNKIRRITISTAQVLTIAGSGTASTVDNATGTSATFKDPTGIAVDANFIYVSDFGGNKIRKIALTAPYAVTTFAGSGATSSMDGTGVAATFNTPFGIALDGEGNLYVTEWGNKIRQITPAGIVTTIAGSGAVSTVDGNGIAATFNDPANMVIDPTTGVGYVSEWTGDRIRKIELGGYTLSPALPAGLSFDILTGSITGTPTNINYGPLNYTITAYNYYGSSTATVALTTANIPSITSTIASALTQTTATTGGNVTTNGGSTLLEKGICWSTSANPTILDTKVVNGTTTTGSYTAAIAGLVASTTYYIRAYATNSVGTAYGTQVSFTTLITPPTISYTASNTFTVNTPITTLAVSNSGGTVSGLASTNVSTFAGSTPGYTNGSGTDAKFYYPWDVTSDALGTIYVADTFNHAIRKISSSGVVTTFAGGFMGGNSDGFGSFAQFNAPQGIATDILGNVFVADGSDNIRKIDASGNVITLVTSPSSSISFHTPKGIVVDTSGIIYFSDSTSRIYKIDTSNNLSVFAGGDNINGTNDGIGTSARFNRPNGLAIDATGNVYVADTYNHRIRKITPLGVVTTLAGSTQGFNDGTGTSAQFNNPFGLTVDASGTIYVAESGNNRIRKITPMGVVTTLAGIASAGSIDGSATLASFTNPTGITSDSDGNLYVSEFITHKIRKITASYGFSISPELPAGLVLNADGSISGTPTVATAATTYTVKATNAGGRSSFEVSITTLALPVITTTAASSITATALTTGGRVTSEAASVTAAGICYSTSPMPTLLDTFTTDVLSVGSFTRTIGNLTTLTPYYIRAYATNSVGTAYGNQIVVNTPMYAPVISYSSPNAFIVNAPITALAVSNSGGAIPTQLYGVSTVAGGNQPGSTDGALGTALFSNPTAVVKDSQGNLFVADYYNHAIRKIAPNGIVSFYAGGGGPGYADGPRANSMFKNPFGLAIDHLDNLYVSEPLAHTIRKITSLGIVSTFAGTNGLSNSDNLSFSTPRGLTCDTSGNVYVIDSGNSRIQKITPNGIISTFFVGVAVGVSYNMVFDSVGNLFLATQSSTGGVKKIDTNGVLTNNLYGTFTKSIAIDKLGNLYTANQWGKIIKLTPSGAEGNLTSGGTGFADGDFAIAKFNGVSGMTMDNDGVMYVADTDNNRIRRINLYGYSTTGLPTGLALNANGSITGTPTVATAATDYVVTATNSGGSSSYTLNFAITETTAILTGGATPTLSTSGSITNFVACSGNTSSEQSFTISGVDLASDITITAPTGYEVSLTSGGTFTGSVALSPTSNTVSTTTIYVRLKSNASNGASGNVVCSATNATSVDVSTGTATVNALPSISGTITLCVGATNQLTGSATAAVSSAWVSATTGVATISDTGLVTGQSSGTSLITYTNSNGCIITSNVTVNALPSSPTGTDGSRIGTGTVAISSSVNAGETIDWYANSTGGGPLSGGTATTSFTTPSISSTTIYYAQARNTTTGCISAARTAVTATVQINSNADVTPPTISHPISPDTSGNCFLKISENTSGVTIYTANETVTWSITGGDDQAKFSISPNGSLTFIAPYPIHAYPTDTAPTNSYIVEITATDAAGNYSRQLLTVNISPFCGYWGN